MPYPLVVWRMDEEIIIVILNINIVVFFNNQSLVTSQYKEVFYL